MHVVTDDGDEFDFGPHDVVDIAPGHDAWVVGDEPVVAVEWSGVRGWLEPLESLSERVLATVVVTDIVTRPGTRTASVGAGGTTCWRDTTRGCGRSSRRSGVERSKRRVTGSSSSSTPPRERSGCARRMVDSSPGDGIAIRAAVHTGEFEFVGDDMVGVAVHEAARVAAVATEGEVLVSAVTETWRAGSDCRSRTEGSTSSGCSMALVDCSRSERTSPLGVPVS